MSTRSPSPGPGTRWWRSSASPSSAPSSGISTTVGEEAHRPRPRAAPPPPAAVGAGPRRTGPGLAGPAGRRGHHPLRTRADAGGRRVRRRPGRRRRREDRSRAARPPRRGDHQALRPRRRRTRPRTPRTATCTSTRATSRSTTRTSTSPAPCASRPRSTSPTVSTSTRPSPTAPRPRRPSARRSPSTPAGPRRSATSPARRPRSTSTPRVSAGVEPRTTRTGLPAAREVVLHAHFDASTDRRHHGLRADRAARGRPATPPARPAQVLVRRLPHQGHRQARHRPQPGEVRARLRDPGPDPRARGPPRPHLRVPVLRPTSPGLRRRPRHRVRPRRRGRRQTPARTHGHRRTSARCAGSTTASRPTPPGATRWSRPECSSGPPRTATATAATAPAPPPSTHPTPAHPGSRRPEDDPAPHPATHEEAGPQARPAGTTTCATSSQSHAPVGLDRADSARLGSVAGDVGRRAGARVLLRLPAACPSSSTAPTRSSRAR